MPTSPFSLQLLCLVNGLGQGFMVINAWLAATNASLVFWLASPFLWQTFCLGIDQVIKLLLECLGFFEIHREGFLPFLFGRSTDFIQTFPVGVLPLDSLRQLRKGIADDFLFSRFLFLSSPAL